MAEMVKARVVARFGFLGRRWMVVSWNQGPCQEFQWRVQKFEMFLEVCGLLRK